MVDAGGGINADGSSAPEDFNWDGSNGLPVWVVFSETFRNEIGDYTTAHEIGHNLFGKVPEALPGGGDFHPSGNHRLMVGGDFNNATPVIDEKKRISGILWREAIQEVGPGGTNSFLLLNRISD